MSALETDRPHTAELFTTIAMVFSTKLHVSGGYMSEVDLVPVWNPAKDT